MRAIAVVLLGMLGALAVLFFSRGAAATEAMAARAAIGRHPPPDRTVFVYGGFEPITMWQHALWSRTWDWDGAPGDATFK